MYLNSNVSIKLARPIGYIRTGMTRRGQLQVSIIIRMGCIGIDTASKDNALVTVFKLCISQLFLQCKLVDVVLSGTGLSPGTGDSVIGGLTLILSAVWLSPCGSSGGSTGGRPKVLKVLNETDLNLTFDFPPLPLILGCPSVR
jgi:hypothetical protein